MIFDPQPHRLEVTYVLLDFPIASEQFVSREIRGLLALGTRVRVLTLRPGCGPVHPATEMDAVVKRARPLWSPRLWAVAALAVVRRPPAAVRMVALALRLSGEEGGRARMKAMRACLLALHFAHRLRAQPPQLIHAHFASSPTTLGLLLAGWFGCPFGFSVHASDLYAEKNDIAAKVRYARHVFVCSSAAAADLRALLPEHHWQRVHALHHGVEIPATAQAVREREAVPLILAVGRFVPKKGFQVLLQACSVLRDQAFGFRCEIVGAGPEEAALSEAIRARGLEQHVRLRPWCEQAELGSYYSRASVLAVPSVVASNRDRDNIPNVVLEALAHGSPVVASALPALSDVLGRSSAGILVQPGNAGALADALRKVCEDRELAQELFERGRQVVMEEFEIGTNARRLFGHLARSAAASCAAGRDAADLEDVAAPR